MPSGKKARGRKNRAKKEAARTADLRSLWEPTIHRDSNSVVSNNTTSFSCEHTLVTLPRIPQESPTVSFMNFLAGEGFFDMATQITRDPVDSCFRSLSRFPRVQEEESDRSLANDLLLRFVRNVFLRDSTNEGENWFHQCHRNEVSICCMIYLLELLRTYSDMSEVRRRTYKIGSRLWCGNRRDTVKFVAKRLPCTCLKKLHRAARKKVEKMGKCIACSKQFPRSQLYVCTGCMYVDYCSRECQRADRSCHKSHCHSPEVK